MTIFTTMETPMGHTHPFLAPYRKFLYSVFSVAKSANFMEIVTIVFENGQNIGGKVAQPTNKECNILCTIMVLTYIKFRVLLIVETSR
jgi:hypothetical protein